MTELNAAQLALFRAEIISLLTDISQDRERGKNGEAIVALDQQSIGRLSRMDALQNQAMAKAQSVRRNAEHARLQAALARLDAGEYGYCEDCGEPIPTGRLHLDLAATLCVSCASG